MMMATKVKLGVTAKIYNSMIKRLKTLGCVLCPVCNNYTWPEHTHGDTDV